MKRKRRGAKGYSILGARGNVALLTEVSMNRYETQARSSKLCLRKETSVRSGDKEGQGSIGKDYLFHFNRYDGYAEHVSNYSFTY